MGHSLCFHTATEGLSVCPCPSHHASLDLPTIVRSPFRAFQVGHLFSRFALDVLMVCPWWCGYVLKEELSQVFLSACHFRDLKWSGQHSRRSSQAPLFTSTWSGSGCLSLLGTALMMSGGYYPIQYIHACCGFQAACNSWTAFMESNYELPPINPQSIEVSKQDYFVIELAHPCQTYSHNFLFNSNFFNFFFNNAAWLIKFF